MDLSLLIKNNRSGRCGSSIYLTPTKRKRIECIGKVLSDALQARCNICSKKTTWCCSKCEDDDNLEKSMSLCSPKSKRMYFAVHVKKCIGDDN